MEFNILKMDEDTRKALHIASVSNSDLTIRGTFKEVNFIKYSDTDVGIEVDDNGNRVEYIFTRKQIEFIAKWING